MRWFSLCLALLSLLKFSHCPLLNDYSKYSLKVSTSENMVTGNSETFHLKNGGKGRFCMSNRVTSHYLVRLLRYVESFS